MLFCYFVAFYSCVVRGMPFYFAVLLPVVVVLLGNMVVLVLVLRAIKDGSQLVKDSRAAKNKKMTHARIAFACSMLLGIYIFVSIDVSIDTLIFYVPRFLLFLDLLSCWKAQC